MQLMEVKNTPGCCGCGGGCSQCCISRIDVDFAVPEAGQPGASLGSWGWDISTQPIAEEVTQTISGIPRLVCRQIYTAPETTVCTGINPLTYNTRFLTKESTIPYTYWQQVFLGNFFWYEGDVVWRTYAYIQELKLTVYRWGGLARTVLSGIVSQSGQKNFFGRRRQYSASGCALIEDVYPNIWIEQICARGTACQDNGRYTIDSKWIGSVFGINRDSGWVSGDCDTLPTNDIGTADIASDQYNPGESPGVCRVPTGSTYVLGSVSLGCTQGGTNFYSHDYTYTTPDVWFARHPITLTTC
jgi:hypothetical protein